MIGLFFQTLAVCGVIFVAGYFPTVRLAGASSVASIVAGIAVSLVSSWSGVVPILANRGRKAAPGNLILTAMAVRLLVALALVLVIALGFEVHRGVFLVWVAISYMGLLVVDTRFALRSIVGASLGRSASS